MGKISKNELNTSLATKIEEIDLKANISDLETTNSQLAQIKKKVLLRKETLQTFGSGVETFLTFQTPIYDTSDFYNSINPTRITIPNGVSKVKLNCGVSFEANATGTRAVTIRKNGSFISGITTLGVPGAGNSTDVQVVTPVIDVVVGDYFEVRAVQFSGGSLGVRGSNALLLTYFSLEVVE